MSVDFSDSVAGCSLRYIIYTYVTLLRAEREARNEFFCSLTRDMMGRALWAPLVVFRQ